MYEWYALKQKKNQTQQFKRTTRYKANKYEPKNKEKILTTKKKFTHIEQKKKNKIATN